MKYTVLFEVDENQLMEIAHDNSLTDLTPKQVFEHELNWLAQSGITPIEIEEVK